MVLLNRGVLLFLNLEPRILNPRFRPLTLRTVNPEP